MVKSQKNKKFLKQLLRLGGQNQVSKIRRKIWVKLRTVFIGIRFAEMYNILSTSSQIEIRNSKILFIFF